MCTDEIFLFPCLLFDLSTYSQEYFLISDPLNLYTHAHNIIERKVIFVLKALFLFELQHDQLNDTASITILVVNGSKLNLRIENQNWIYPLPNFSVAATKSHLFIVGGSS